MRTITKTYNVYNADELVPEALQMAKEKYYNDDMTRQMVMDMYCDDTVSELEQLGFDNVKFECSLSYSQGDGVNFTFDTLYVDDIIKIIENLKNEKYEFETTFDDIDTSLLIMSEPVLEIDIVNHRYVHEYSKSINLYDDYDGDSEEVISFLYKLECKFKRLYIELCKHFERIGYKQLEYRMNDDEFIETSNNNDWEYTEDGKFYNN